MRRHGDGMNVWCGCVVIAFLCRFIVSRYGVGRGCGLGRGLGVGEDLGVGVAVAVGVAVGVGVGVLPLCTSKEPMSIRPFTTR